MSTPTAQPPERQNHTLRRYAFALAIVILLVIAFALTVQDRRLDLRQQLSAIGLNLMASVVFAVIFTVVSSRIQERVLQSQLTRELDTRFERLSSQMTTQIATTNTQYLPARTYQPASEARDDFNRDVSTSLDKTGLYLFRGTSAKYVAARIKASSRQLQGLKVITLDPGSDRILRPRAVDRSRIPSNRGKSVEALVAEIRDEILMSMVALFDCRELCSIEVTYAAETAVTRADLFDDAVYLSWYYGPESTRQTFPEAFRFDAGSFVYSIQRSEMFRRFEVAEQGQSKFDLDPSQEDADLISLLKDSTDHDFSREDLTRWRQSYETFSRPFIAQLERL
jgi:hypothetical protein